jgi:hypothetical protein
VILWDTCKKDFVRDGSLRDIYVLHATAADCQTAFNFLRKLQSAVYTVDGIETTSPETIDQVFKARATASPMLCIRVGHAAINFHFFATNEIEGDLDPREVSSQSDLDSILAFLRVLGDAVQQQVVLTPENCREQPIITYDPSDASFAYHASGI